MKYTSEYTAYHQDRLVLTPRKRRHTATFLYVEIGLVLVRLGKHDIPVYAGQGFWLPFDCLYALMITPHTSLHQLTVSPRVTVSLPQSTGHVIPSALLHAGLTALDPLSGANQNTPATRRLHGVLLDQLVTLSPAIAKDASYQCVAACVDQANAGRPLEGDNAHFTFQACTQLTYSALCEYLTVRQLRAQLKSGNKLEAAATSLGLSYDTALALSDEYQAVLA
ncbi:hypothetical protein [Salinivibrio sp. IB872]|uniref:hypothetical protein n=1 Tax=Salinivibrio sp. IB872 TaxID=1766123 RepID=UPI0009851A67|nr:hypothetical protein [Salinivibrio sp. IB872]OOF23162.1 hypothetical protein BZJ18_14385 [Salinivibrio sp. IB872]